MKKTRLVHLMLMLLTLSAFWCASVTPATAAAPESKGESTAVGPRTIDLAICLDTSNSMDGLIESAKQKLWAIVNELAGARPKPILRVALYQYGNTGLTPESGWVQQVSD